MPRFGALGKELREGGGVGGKNVWGGGPADFGGLIFEQNLIDLGTWPSSWGSLSGLHSKQ